ncbi:3-hydroxyacyl-CoA dehydrogenase-like protein [Corynespora cassiicola Philippines]|uniref:3-hydroxyacyl-CoA dehydrogenase-like protein n=1 Tax=Corynespora cassiicola Philippines TaxID=1448308 RepID=A0A2T2N312_CORCC|nr:3-hydroxyacyl-CoA dehydrogenase-like protein [Corynespora cassiicola Philippines]
MALQDQWVPPPDHNHRPVAVLGAGVLGRRIASCWAAAGYTVHVYDPAEEQRREAVAYFQETKDSYQKYTPGPLVEPISISYLESAVSGAWHVIECVPESLRLKQQVFAELESLCASDCILATNSSSFKSSMVSEKMDLVVKKRVLNTHYFMLPHLRAVELMTNGSTAPEIFPFLTSQMKQIGLHPFVAQKESTGFIQNRVWAAIKREMLHVVSEGVTDPKTADDIFYETIVLAGTRPFAAMDLVGLDTVALIEQHYAQERSLDTTHTTTFLHDCYISAGKLGLKSPQKGGFYPPAPARAPGQEQNADAEPTLFVLDNGLSGQVDTLQKGRVLEYSASGTYMRTLASEQYLPDGIAVREARGRRTLFWSCMGFPGQEDGQVYTLDLSTDTTSESGGDGGDGDGDGESNPTPLFAPGTLNTPKQIALDEEAGKLYVADREGLAIWRCGLDGTDAERVVVTGDKGLEADRKDATKWCVGVAISRRMGKLFWTQKGPAKGWQGRIFCAGLETPTGSAAEGRRDVECLLSGLAEPVDLQIHEGEGCLYWTDRGEMPFGNTLNRVFLDGYGRVRREGVECTPLLGYQVLARKFHEAIGLAVDVERGFVYVADLGGSISRCRLDGSEKIRLVFEEGRAWTGIALG